MCSGRPKGCPVALQREIHEGVLTAEDQRGLTPLFWSHVLPYGKVKLNMTSRLSLGTT